MRQIKRQENHADVGTLMDAFICIFLFCVCVCVGVIGKEEHDEQDIVICIDRLCTIFTGVLETVLETA